jgi:hypothetical protein
MAKVQYESQDDAGHKVWTARYGATPSGSTPTNRALPVDDHPLIGVTVRCG